MAGLTKILRTIAIAVAIGVVAMALPAAILAATGGPQSVIVIFVKAANPDSLPRNVTILSWNSRIARLDGIDAAAARRLYAQGAVLVMPYRKSGCMAYRKA